MSLDVDDPLKMDIHQIVADILVAQGIPRVPTARRNKEWKPIFCPRGFLKDHTDITLEHYALGEKRLRNFAIEVTKFRSKFKIKAMDLNHSHDLEALSVSKDVNSLA